LDNALEANNPVQIPHLDVTACFTKDDCLYYDFYEQNNSFQQIPF